MLHARRIGERAEEVEHRARAELDPRRADMPHRGMVGRREHEADARPRGCSRAIFSGAEVDLHAERREHVRRAGFRRERAVAVLGDRHARAGDDEGGAGRDVVGAGRVAAGADDVDRARRGLRPASSGRASSATAPAISSIDLAADAERHQEAADLARRRLARHEDAEGRLAPRRGSARSPDADLGEEGLHGSSASASAISGGRPAPGARVEGGGDVEEILQDARGRARRRCSRDGTARRAPGRCGAAAP